MLFCVAESQNKVYKCRKLDTGKYIFKLSTTKLQNARLQKFTFNMLRSNLGYIHLPPHQCACNSKKHKETNKKIPTLFFLTISDFQEHTANMYPHYIQCYPLYRFSQKPATDSEYRLSILESAISIFSMIAYQYLLAGGNTFIMINKKKSRVSGWLHHLKLPNS